MNTKIEVLRSFGRWEEVDCLGQEPYEIKSNISNARTRYIIGEDEDGTGAILTTISPVKDDLARKLSGLLRGTLYDLESVSIEAGHTVFIEGILPGNTKSEMLRLTQE
jgi:hypothetical protein